MRIEYISCDNSRVIEKVVDIELSGEWGNDDNYMICTRENGGEFQVACDRVIGIKDK